MLSLKHLTPEQRAAALRSLIVCVLYGLTAMLVALVYKWLMSVYGYNAKYLMLSYQLLLALCLCAVLKRWFQAYPTLAVPDFDWNVFKASLLPGVFFVANIVIGWYGLALVNVPLFLAIRRTATAFTLGTDYIILGKLASAPVMVAVGLIVCGALMASWHSLSSDAIGLLFTLGNNVCTAVSMSMTKRFSDSTGTRGLGIVMYNALVALPVCLCGAFLMGEVPYTLTSFTHRGNPSFWLGLLSASLIGVYMNYIVFLCTTMNSPLATSVTGNVKDILSTAIGAVLFGDFKATPLNVSGLMVSFAGAGLFSVAKVRESAASAASAKAVGDGRIATSAKLSGAKAPSLEAPVYTSASDTEAASTPKLALTAPSPRLGAVDAPIAEETRLLDAGRADRAASAADSNGVIRRKS